MKREIVRVMKSLYDRSLVTALEGNVSGRLPGAKEFWITPTQLFKGELKPEDLIKVDLNGRLISGSHKPSIETPIHAAIYRVREDVNAIVHAHNPWLTGLNLAGVELKTTVMVDAAILLKDIGSVKFRIPGSADLAEDVAFTVKTGVKAVILENHGVIGVGRNLLEAENIVELMETLAVMQFISYVLGRRLKEIQPEEVKRLRERFGVR